MRTSKGYLRVIVPSFDKTRVQRTYLRKQIWYVNLRSVSQMFKFQISKFT